MTGLEIIFLILVIILLVTLSYSIILNYRMGIILLRVQDNIEECLDILDERYASMTKVLEIPIFFDSVEVRRVVDDIRKSRDSVLYIANSLSSFNEDQELE